MGIIVDADGVYVWDRTVLTGTVGNLTTTVEEYKTVTDGIKGEWGVTINALGYVCGVKLLADYSQEEPTSDFTIMADTFSIVTTGTSPKTPFTIGTVNGVSSIGINGNMIIDGTVTVDKLAATVIEAVSATITDSIVIGEGTIGIVGPEGPKGDPGDPGSLENSVWAYPGTVLIDGGKIYTDTITANHIIAGTITTNEIAVDAGISGTRLDIAGTGTVTISLFAEIMHTLGRLPVVQLSHSDCYLTDFTTTSFKIWNGNSDHGAVCSYVYM